jgi:Protein of unknown function (DUF3179)
MAVGQYAEHAIVYAGNANSRNHPIGVRVRCSATVPSDLSMDALGSMIAIDSADMVTPDEARTKRRLRSFVLGSCLFLASLAGLALALYPIYVIRPFREQEPAALQRALWVTLHDKAILFAIFLLITMCVLYLWRRAGWAARLLLLTPAVGVALLAAGAAWVNPYEQLMFHPLGEPRYVAIQQAGVDPKDMVIAVTLGGESRAYPIREMAYHHVVNDRLHQLPIVVTY